MNHPLHYQHLQYYVDCNGHRLRAYKKRKVCIAFVWNGRNGSIVIVIVIVIPENKNGKASASRGDVVSDPVVPAAAIAKLSTKENKHLLKNGRISCEMAHRWVTHDNHLPVVIVGGAVNTRSLPYVVFSCVTRIHVAPSKYEIWKWEEKIAWKQLKSSLK